MVNGLFGNPMWVAENRVEEYKGYELDFDEDYIDDWLENGFGNTSNIININRNGKTIATANSFSKAREWVNLHPIPSKSWYQKLKELVSGILNILGWELRDIRAEYIVLPEDWNDFIECLRKKQYAPESDCEEWFSIICDNFKAWAKRAADNDDEYDNYISNLESLINKIEM